MVIYPDGIVFGGIDDTVMVNDAEFVVASAGSTRWRVKSQSFCETSVE